MVLNPDLHKKVVSDLASLARTCRVFKESALDVLWRALIDMSPLARCLPEASQGPLGNMVRIPSMRHAQLLDASLLPCCGIVFF